jgi:hypothetical protein
MLFLLLPSCSSRMYLSAQTGARAVDPPTHLQVCPYPDESPQLCDPLEWVGDHYAVHAYPGWKDHIYLLVEWSNGNVTLAVPNFENKSHVAAFKGQIAASGDHIINGTISGIGRKPQAFTSMWFPRFESADIAKYLAANKPDIAVEEAKSEIVDVAGGPSHRVNGINIPSGATDVFATYPADVRAILLPDYKIGKDDAMRPCDDSTEDDTSTGITDPLLALEIGKFALRRGEVSRGHCWINHSAYLNKNPRAITLLGVIHLMDWGTKDPKKAYNYFSSQYEKHDVWALYFLEQCWLYAIGTDKDITRAAKIDAYLMTTDIYSQIGSDDQNVVDRAANLQKMMNPNTKTVTNCYQVGPNSTLPGAPKNKRCEEMVVPAGNN